MTSNEQEALSFQHASGIWIVALKSGAFAVFDHPAGKLLRIIEQNIEEELVYESIEASKRWKKSQRLETLRRKAEGRSPPKTSTEVLTLKDLGL